MDMHTLDRMRAVPEIEEALRERAFGRVRSLLADHEPYEIADILEAADEADRVVLLRVLPRDQAAEVFEDLVLCLFLTQRKTPLARAAWQRSRSSAPRSRCRWHDGANPSRRAVQCQSP